MARKIKSVTEETRELCAEILAASTPAFTRCPSDDPSECSLIRERSVAGISDDVPACPVHGAFVEGA